MVGITNNFNIKTKALWAKKRVIDGLPYWLPLLTHLKDTEKVIVQLYNHWLSNSQRRLLETNFGEEKVLSLISFIGLTHDIGKATPAMQTKPSFGNTSEENNNLDNELIMKLVHSGFNDLQDLQLASRKASPHALAGEAILLAYGVPASITAIVGGHHGKPLNETPDEDIEQHTKNYWQSDHDQSVQSCWQQVQRQLFEYGLTSAGFKSSQEIPQIDQVQAVLLNGLLIVADWLASSENLNDDINKPLFPLIKISCGVDDIDEEQRFESAWLTWQLTNEWEPQPVSLKPDPYQIRWQFSARPVQRTITEAIEAAIDPGIIIIEAPMGLGKTETALLAAEQVAYKKGQNGLFFGLPTQATSDAMFDRVTQWMQYLIRENATSQSVRLMHGKSQFNQGYQNLPDAKDALEMDDEGQSNIVINQWFSGKKAILDEFVIGTIDQLLLLSLKQKHLVLKHIGLSKKVIVIDEVHAYDAYMNQYLYRTLNWLGAYHVPVIVLSATLPKAKRKTLIEAYSAGKNQGEIQATDNSWQETDAYPLVTMLDGNKINQITQFIGKNDQQKQRITVERFTIADEALIDDILAKLDGGGIAGIIVNTVKRAQTIAQLVPVDIPMIVLHSAFLAPDRATIEQRLQATIGKNGQRPEKMIVIGTQVLEQSLDIDFDILYTDVAPIDLLLQRAGRLHRHQRKRPIKLRAPNLIVMGIEQDHHYGQGNEAIYQRYLLMKTDYYLPRILVLPDDISPLVQAVYDSKNDPDIVGLVEEKQVFDKRIAQAKEKANTYRIKKPSYRRRADLHGWLQQAQSMVDKDEQRANAAVRDIEESLEVVLLIKQGQHVTLLNGQSLAVDLLDAEARQIAQQVVRLPNAITRGQISKAIEILEQRTANHFASWQESRWLKGTLVLLLDENSHTTFLDSDITYSNRYGLSFIKKGEDND